jgi:metal-responsive CopG/Arc/MetJ family transcriptional regulator
MARLQPGEPVPLKSFITTVTLTEELDQLLKAEQERVNASSRSDLVRRILEEYFKQEVE